MIHSILHYPLVQSLLASHIANHTQKEQQLCIGPSCAPSFALKPEGTMHCFRKELFML
jgi:hypothetical protein